MTTTPRRQEGHNGAVGRRARQRRVLSHIGNPRAFLRRHEWEAEHLASSSEEKRQEFFSELLERTIDDRNLKRAWDKLSRQGGQAPGSDGLRYSDLTRFEVYEFIRSERRKLRKGRYRPASLKRVKTPKASGRGTRTLSLSVVGDRMVQRAILQIVQPFIDPTFHEFSYGYRPDRGRCHALASAESIARTQNRWFWICEDIKDAFDNVPIQRLLDIVKLHIPCERLIQLIKKVAGRSLRRGIEQGNAVSPLLLNIYLDHFLDKPWTNRFPQIPLLRVADDLLILCATQQEAKECHDVLQQMLQAAGMPLKGTPETTIRHLERSESVQWLGFQLCKGRKSLEVQLGEKTWKKLTEKMEEAHSKPDSPLRVREGLLGWIAQQGPTYGSENVVQVYKRISQTAQSLAFEEIPSLKELESRWQRAHGRWLKLRDNTDQNVVDEGGSASQEENHVDSGAAAGVSERPSSAAPSYRVANEITLYAHGGGSDTLSVGGWAFVVKESDSVVAKLAGSSPKTTKRRMEILSILRGLERIPESNTVRLLTDSQYVVQGVQEWLPEWRSRNWRVGWNPETACTENRDLWQRLGKVLEERQVLCELLPEEGADSEFQECITMAQQAVRQRTHV